MKMPPRDPGASVTPRFSWLATADSVMVGAAGRIALTDLHQATSLDTDPRDLCGRSVLIATQDQLTTALALIELHGVARRLVLCPPDLAPEHREAVIAEAGIEAIVCDDDTGFGDIAPTVTRVACSARLRPMSAGIASNYRFLEAAIQSSLIPAQCPEFPISWRPAESERIVPPLSAPMRLPPAGLAAGHLETEWVLLTSGTTGKPKMVVHSLAGLTGAITPSGEPEPVVWATFYDIRRYGGLQIFLRALLGGTPLILTRKGEPVGDHLARLRREGMTHLTGTPSHWRNALMSPAARQIAPRYVRLSGEIADQAILDQLRSFYPGARIVHAYASTEAGVGFEVTDECEGFPASLLEGGGVEIKLADGTLRIRSSRAARGYVGGGSALTDEDGFVDTGDMVEQRGERCYFVGRRGGIINIGGAKVHPEEVEAAINRHPGVRMSRVRSRKNPITGAIVVADVVLEATGDEEPTVARTAAIKAEILQLCRQTLAQHKVPAALNFVPTLAVSANGKLVRDHA